MCGIFGYIGSKNAGNVILDGLKRLEYRGYDSWGIAVKTGVGVTVDKHVGKIGDAKPNLPEGTVGIGHTRWATHGGVEVKNAHPHTDCTGRITLVHNGIVENYDVLKRNLLKKGHTFNSDTDTEVIVHLIEEYLKHEDFFEAVKNAFNTLHGLSAIVVLDARTGTIIAAKNGSPLILGIGTNEYFLASDLSGITPHTQEVVFIKDQEMIVLDPNPTLYSLPKGSKIPLHVEKITWKTEEAELGSYQHFMMKEIVEQSKVVDNILVAQSNEIKMLAKAIKKAKNIYTISAGTAYHSSVAGMYLLSELGIRISPVVASEFDSVMPFIDKNTLVIALSQSGETIDVIEPLSKAQKKGATVAALVNALGSTVYRMADIKLLLHAGPEKAVASTKAYIAKLSMLLLLCDALSSAKDYSALLKKVSEEIRVILQEKNLRKLRTLAKKLVKSKNIYLIGRGISYQSALEGALKIKEVSYIPTEGLPGGELKHGTLALIEKGVPCIVFAPLDKTHDAVISNAIEIRSRGGYIIGVSPKKSDAFDEWIQVKDLGQATILTQIVPIQLLAYFLALEKGIKDPDKPRNLAKSVTVK